MPDEYMYCYVVAPNDGTVDMPLIECDLAPGHDGPHVSTIQVRWENANVQ